MAGPVDYDPFSPEAMADPFPLYRELRAQGPVHPLPHYDAWVLPRFAEVWEVAQDRRHFSIFEGPVFARDRLLEHHRDAPDVRVTRPLGSFSTLDPPLHTELRQAMFPSFTPRACRDEAGAVEALVAGRLAELAGRDEIDVVADFAGPVATAATLRFLGLPETDAAHIGPLINASTRRDPGRPGTSAQGAKAREALHSYVTAHVAARRTEAGASEGADIIDRLLGFRVDGAPLDDSEIAGQLGTILVGGAETLPKIIAAGAAQLARHRDQRARLVAHPELADAAFEEMVRLEGVLQFIGRTLTAPAVIGGQAMRPGQRVILLLQSANRDEREFTDPDAFSIDRVMPRHLGFGHGVHFCIGAHQARLVGVALLRGLLRAFPEFDVDLDRAERPPSEFQIGYVAMPLAAR